MSVDNQKNMKMINAHDKYVICKQIPDMSLLSEEARQINSRSTGHRSLTEASNAVFDKKINKIGKTHA